MTSMGFTTESGAGKIVDYLQRNGEGSVKDFAALLGVSATAVREHLVHLQADGLIVARAERRGPGRPRLVYGLSEKAQSLFPKQYDRLISVLLRELIALEGPDKVAQILDGVSQRLASEYADRMHGTVVAERLGELRRLLELRGVPAEVAPEGAGITLFACPYYDVAHMHPQVCSMERQMIEYVLGEKLDLQNSIREGAHSCNFTLRETETPDGRVIIPLQL
jgi:DeoR family suf operon transcriptional repressor